MERDRTAERAARARAARAYAGLEQRAVAGKLEWSPATLRRLERGQRHDTSLEELNAIADICGVPREFMEYGFPEGEDSIEARLGVVERGLDQLRELIVELTTATPTPTTPTPGGGEGQGVDLRELGREPGDRATPGRARGRS